MSLVMAVEFIRSLESDTSAVYARTLTSVKFVRKDWLMSIHSLRLWDPKMFLHPYSLESMNPLRNRPQMRNLISLIMVEVTEVEEVAVEEEEAAGEILLTNG
jgi:hypothetical protein